MTDRHDSGASLPPRRVGVSSLVSSVLGVIALVVGLFGVNYLRSPSTRSFLDYRRAFAANHAPVTWTTTFFSWAAFTLAAIAVLLAIVAALPTPLAPVVRVAGAVVGLAGTAYMLFLPALDGQPLSGHFEYGLGMYFIAAGFLLLSIAAALGAPRRRVSPAAEYDLRTA